MSHSSQRQVRHIMKTSMEAVSVNTTLTEATEIMERARISSLLVKEYDIPVGILTERDIMRALGQGMPPKNAVEIVMTRGLICVDSKESVHAAYHKMALHSIRHLVVVNEAQQPVGILSETDFRKQRGVESFVGVLNVGKAMSQSYVSALAEFSVQKAALLMQVQKASCAIVVEQERALGVVTERDMVRLFRTQSANLSLSEVMTAPVASVQPEVPLSDAVNRMQQLRIRRLAVVDREGKLVGVLNEHDIVRHLEDEYVQMLQQLVAQQAQELNQDQFRAVLNNLPDKIVVKDANSVYVSCNLSYANELGTKLEEIPGKSDFDFYPKELADIYREEDQQVIQSGKALTFEVPQINNGEKYWTRTTKTPMRNANGDIIGVVVVFRDITLEKRDVDELKQRTWALEAITECNKAVALANSEVDIWQNACFAITSEDRYALAWVGWAEHTPDKAVKMLAFAGNSHHALGGFRVSWGDNEYGNGPTGMTIRLNKTQIGNGQSSQLDGTTSTLSVVDFGIRSYLILPIRINQEVVGAMMVCAYEPDAFSEKTVRLFEGLVTGISFSIESLRNRISHLEAVETGRLQSLKLEKSLQDALTAISAVLEQRDPYTAGHQKHVAHLAQLIGKEIGIDEDKLHALYLSGIVHDLGKIQIPFEILCKPSRLLPVEFALIKKHPEVGYNILAPIDFPWPIAQIVRQHHEYLDGSGYPLGLTAEHILPESKILTVADIVESMSADRPYRPALGIEQAIQEIQRMRGTKLDEMVVDACVKVLKRGDFTPAQMSVPS